MSSGNMQLYAEVSSMRLSYLRARDPSIINFNAPRLPLPVNLENRYSDDDNNKIDKEAEEEEERSDHLSVFLRIKNGVPFKDLYEIDGCNLVCNSPEGSYSTRNMKVGNQLKKIYTFTKIFGPEDRQVDVFNYMVKPKVLRFINGQNNTLFTYGVSGSGKTFTIVGTADEPGIIPRALEYIFRTIKGVGFKDDIKPLPAQQVRQMSKEEVLNASRDKATLLNASFLDKHFHAEQYRKMQQSLIDEPVAHLEVASDVYVSIWVSFAEIYNEYIYDLLQLPQKNKEKPKLRLGCTKYGTYIKQLTSINVQSGVEAYQILQFGINNLKYASTALNCHSSRSHSIFTIKMVQWKKNSDACISTINFCDLAGSERLKKTGNVGDRLKESNNINISLLVLGRCIENIRAGQKMNQMKSKPIPFRESKLTRLFQNALMGFEDMNIIININPSLGMFDESQHALNFAAIAQQIISIEKPIRMVRNRFSEMLQKQDGPTAVQLRSVSDEEFDRIQNELQRIQDQNIELQLQMNQMQAEHYEEIQSTVDEATVRFRNIWENRIKQVKERAEYDLQALRQQYEEKIREMQEDVIEISSDEEPDERDNMLKDAENCVKDLQTQVRQLQNENELLCIRILELEEKEAKLEEQLLAYHQTLPLLADTDISNENSEDEGGTY